MTFTIDPTDHWMPGDRAYCIRGLKKDGRHIVEAGRVYVVVDARQFPGMMNDGLKLEGVDTGDIPGFWSNRFVCLRGRPPFTEELAQRTRRSWYEAYRACADARGAMVLQGQSA